MGNGILILQRGANVTPEPSTGKLLIPNMTANNAPSGVAYSTFLGHQAYFAFDGNFRSKPLELKDTITLNDYVMYTFAKPVKRITEWFVLADEGPLGAIITLCGIYAVMTDGTEVELGRFIENYYSNIFRGECDVSGAIQAIKIKPLEFQSGVGFNIYGMNVVGVE